MEKKEVAQEYYVNNATKKNN